jgi:hypothetical protein
MTNVPHLPEEEEAESLVGGGNGVDDHDETLDGSKMNRQRKPH